MAEELVEDTLWVFPPDFYPWLEGINAEQHFPPGGINAENIHLVFSLSPFCTPESANKRFEMLVNRKPEMLPRYFNRDAFEDEVKEFPGESFIIIAGPRKTPPGGREAMNMLWVVERRYTTLDRGALDEADRKVVEVRGHYIIVADRIIAAPTLMDVVQSRWSASMLHLSNFYRTASSLPLYSIEKGYSYLHPSQKKKAKTSSSAGGSTLASARTSRAGSPTAGSETQQTSSARPKEDVNDDLAISRSFNLTLSYAEEFMDDNPLIGEPGFFKLTASTRGVKEKEARERAADDAREKARSEAASKSEVGESRRVSAAPSPPPPSALPPLKTAGLERKGSTVGSAGKGKSPTSATSDGALKKRRKSKAPITPGALKSP